MSDEPRPPTPKADRPWLLLAGAGIVLALGLILGVLIARSSSLAPDRQSPIDGDREGEELALVLEGTAPTHVAAGEAFEITCRVVSVGAHPLGETELRFVAGPFEVRPLGGDAAWVDGYAHVVEPGRTYTIALRPRETGRHALHVAAVAAGTRAALSWEIEAHEDRPLDPQPLAGHQTRVRLSTFAPERVPVGHPFRVVAVVENDGVADTAIDLSPRCGIGLEVRGQAEARVSLEPRQAHLLPGVYVATRPGRHEIVVTALGDAAGSTSVATVVAE